MFINVRGNPGISDAAIATSPKIAKSSDIGMSLIAFNKTYLLGFQAIW